MHDDDIRRTLADLPEPPLPAGLWSRVQAAQARRAARLRGGVAGVLAIAVVAVGALSFGVLPQPQSPGADDTSSGVATTVDVASDEAEDVRAIDRALQAAYARGASDDEIEPLWQARRRHLPSSVSGT